MFHRLLRREADDSAGLDRGLERTRRGLIGQLTAAFRVVDITDDTWAELEELLILADVGPATAEALVATLRDEARRTGVRRAAELKDLLAEVMIAALSSAEGSQPLLERKPDGPAVIMVVGANGGGKTTSIAKMAALFREEGKSVVLVAADTFRAAAIEQLQAWGERCGIAVLAGKPGGDPGAVVFDALSSSAARGADIVIVDTAGRLHTQTNLMSELGKVRNVAGRVVAGAPHETLLVLDATTGQNGLAQARAFLDAVSVTGLILAKLDSSAKGGVAFAIARELGMPIRFVGVGEGLADLVPFDAEAYVASLLDLDDRAPSARG